MKKLFFFLILCISGELLASGVGTKFQLYVPPNAANTNREVAVMITAIYDSTYINLKDDNADGDNDDSYSGLLRLGETYIRYIKDGSVNDDAGGKWDGDYFVLESNKPVIFGQFVKGDNAQEFAVSDNGTMKGTVFYLYTPQSVSSKRDLNVFAYEDNTQITLKDITVSAQNSTGVARVNLNSTNIKFSTTLNTKQDLLEVKTNGRNALDNGKTYLLITNKPVTVQIGSLYQSTRHSGSYVPGIKGSTLDNFFYFAIPNEKKGEQELKIVSFNNNTNVKLDRLNTSDGQWINIGDYNLNQNGYQTWLAGNNDQFPLFRVQATGGNVSLFQCNYFESGNNNGRNDEYAFTPSDNGDKAGQNFTLWLPEPGDMSNCKDPFTGSNYGTRYSHLFLYANANANVTIIDLATNGSVINTNFQINAGRYYDFKVNSNTYNSLTQSSRQPYLKITSSSPIVTGISSWYNSWFSFATSSVANNLSINSKLNFDSVYSGNNVTYSGVSKNSGYNFTTKKLTVIIPDGFNVVSSSLTTQSQGNVGSGTVTAGGNNSKNIVWNNFTFNPNDSLNFSVVVSALSNFTNGSPIPNGTEFNLISNILGQTISDTLTSQASSVLKIKNNNAYIKTEKYITAFEDLKNSSWNDWDVNDWVAGVIQTYQGDSLGRLTKATFDIESLARGSSFDHSFYLTLKLLGNSTSTLTVRDSLGNIVTDESFSNQQNSGNFNVKIFNSTKKALPPAPGMFATNTFFGQNFTVKGWTAKLEVTFSDRLNLINELDDKKIDPWILTQYGNEIHIASISGLAGNTQNVDNNVILNTPLYSYFLALGYKVPFDWKWPYEGPSFPIWVAYPEFQDYIISGEFINNDWYEYPDTSKVWKRRIVEEDNKLITLKNFIHTETDNYRGQSIFLDTIGKFFGSPKIADVNRDGNMEVFIGCLDTRLYGFNSSGENLPGFPIPTGGIIRSTPAIDTNYNGASIIAFGSDDGYLYCVTSAGKTLPGFPVNTDGPIKSSPVIADLRGDGQKYIVVFSGSGKLFIYNLQGDLISGFPKTIQKSFDTFGSLLILPSPAVADLFNDGSREIITGTIDSNLYVLSNNGEVLRGFPQKLDNLVYSSPIVSKFQDGTNKIILATSGGTIYIFNSDGNIFSRKKLADEFITSPVIYDINKDGTKDIIIASTDGVIHCLNSENLSTQWTFQGVSSILSTPVIADINGDDFAEIIISNMMGATLVIDHEGFIDELNTSSIPLFNSWVVSSPAIGDINGNGKLDLILASYDETIRGFEFTNSNSSSKVFWQSFGYNIGNTRWDESDYSPPPQPDQLGRIFNYPNPVTEDKTTVRIELPVNSEEITMRIFDLGGELVKEVSKKELYKNGIYWDYVWDLKNGKNVIVANGIYLIQVEAKVNGVSYSKNQKMGVAR
ncbi:MAG TPA: DUF4842 domain-containing protein [Ignavibacteria bacterium]|nr:DUF4842 domain-containing protein [Ignavibacteria bacterium]